MTTENKNILEEVILNLKSQKSRMLALILSCISVLFSLVYLLSVKTGAVMTVYSLCLLVASSVNILYSLDVKKKLSFSNDILVAGIFISLLGMLIRTIQLGTLFSITFFVAYLVFTFTFSLIFIKHTKSDISEKVIIALLILMTAYSLFEIAHFSSMNVLGTLSLIYYRLAEATLFISYIAVLLINKSQFENFKESLASYKNQIPSAKIISGIIIFISLISLIFGAALHFGNRKSTVAVTKTTKITEKTKTENKASGTVSDNPGSASKTVTQFTKDLTEEITVGQTVSTKNFDFTLNKVEFSYRVEPDAPPSWYTYYDAPENEVYIYVNASVKNNQKQSAECDEIYSVTADYNNGYTYRGFNIADDTDGDFTYANITSVEPLQTLGVHCLVACPEEVETSESPLFLTITFKDGSKYKYTIR